MTDEGDIAREIYGVATNDTDCIFNEHKLKEIWAAPPVRPYGVPKHVIIGIDTNSGRFKTDTKATSKFAMISLIENRDNSCIVGIENVDATVPSHYTPVLINHMRELERRFPHSQLVVIVDGMLAMDGGHIQEKFFHNSINNVVFVSTGNAKPGVQIGPDEKRDFMITMNDAINEDRITFHQEITTSGNLKQLKEEFLDQMCKFSQLKLRPDKDDPYKPVSIHYTGKLVKGQCDDLW